ncbi:hypothetical protein SS50377_25671 [Spironucleus salmonicida]|uniref:Uncharacterized protein n=1 Tax=Spironucleus salmonicida TaxID=348837 RepID=V6LEL4_9EUKA|nr:hypothetical protein SS50377_25671 [Spironucleus salmonicida]|eukprot:EST42693.1 hypothetical protein SS50377_17714 [Spironucleus salmonicida]
MSSQVSESSLLFSQTASLNSVNTDLNNHLQQQEYWTTNQPREVDIASYSQVQNNKYLNYRNRQTPLNTVHAQQYSNTQQYQQYQGQNNQIYNQFSHQQYPNQPQIPNDLDNQFSNSVTPNLMISQLPEELLPQQILDPRYYPQNNIAVPKQQKKQYQKQSIQNDSQVSIDSNDSNQSVITEKTWKQLINRAQKALDMKITPKLSENSIQNIFERMLKKIEVQHSHNNLPECAKQTIKKGNILKSLPADDNSDELKSLKSKWKDDNNENIIPSSFLMPETAEERQFDQKINQLKPAQIKNLVLKLNQFHQCQTPEQLLEATKASKNASNQLSQLKQAFTLGAERLQALASQVPGNDDYQIKNGYSQLFDGFVKRCEQQYGCVEASLMELRELNRLRSRILQLLGISKNPQSIYEVIKLNAEILEKLQLQLNQRDSVSPAFLAAEEFSARCREAKIGTNPINQNLITYADTVLYSSGEERQKYVKQCVRQACQDQPKILIRLTDTESYEAFQAIIFVLNHFGRLFNTNSIGRMITRLTEVQNFTEQSRTLVTAIKKILGLQQTSSTNKILEAIQAIAIQAADEVGVFSPDEAGEIMQLLNVQDASDVIGAIKSLKVNKGEDELDERRQEDQEDDD